MASTAGLAASPKRRRVISLLSAFLMTLASLTTAVITTAGPAEAASSGDSISYTLEGCKSDGNITLPISGRFVCPSSLYTTGNLGKEWAELDLVPVRVTLQAGNSAPATQNFAFVLSVGYCDDTSGVTGPCTSTPGYDVLSSDAVDGTPVLNTGLSDNGCGTLTSSAPAKAAVGKETALYRTLSVTGQAKNTTCVYDAYARIALGAHEYPGASLHFNLYNDALDSGQVGNKEVSINPNEVAPQELDKDMTATQDSDHVWSVVKSPTPASLNFANTCDPAAALSKSVAITVTWTKLAATPSGDIDIVTHVYATNPASRAITTSVSDQIYSGTTAVGPPVTAGPTVVPANTANVLLLTHTTSVPAGTTNLNDVATATYTDTVTQIPIPGTVTATATANVQSSGLVTNGSATITDVESITGSGLSFSVDSFSGASGSFDNAYVAGTQTIGSVSWTSTAQSGSGSVTFNKTVYATAATVDSTGGLSDTATLTGSDGFTTGAQLTVDVDTDAATRINVSKRTSLRLASAQTFNFNLWNKGTPDTDTGQDASVTIPAGGTGPVASGYITGLSPTGSYFFKEDAQAPYPAVTTAPVTFALVAGDASSCSVTVNVTNQAAPATARVQKTTSPVSSGMWTFTLTGPNGLSETLNNVQAGAGYALFASTLEVDGGTYTITETLQSGYDLTGITGDVNGNTARVTTSALNRTCSFTLDLTTDSGTVFSCNFVNTQRGTIIVKKVTNPVGASGSFTFTGDAAGTISDQGTITVANLVPGTYTSTEADPTPAFDLTSISCDDSSSTTPSSGNVATRTATFKLDPGETVTCTFTNRQRGTIIVKKVTNPVGATGSFAFTGDAAGTIGDQGTITVSNLVPGTYTSTEADPAPAFDLTSITCNDGGSSNLSTGNVSTRTATFRLDPGETVTCTFTNRERGRVNLVKTVTGSAPSGNHAFTFQLRSGATPALAGTILESKVANAANGGNVSFSTNLVPGQTYQFCEIVMPGWQSTLGTFVPDSFIPPDGQVPNPNVDNSIVCINFTVAAGETKTITVDNTPPPGGRALTIGFWKNWSSCSGGKQKPVLDQTLASMSGGGILFGSLFIDTCLEATRILNKSTVDTGKKMSSDPLYNMAAQLLAAQLNFQAGSGKCGAAITAVNSAMALLATYNFDGKKAYAKTLSKADTTTANQLAITLDRYNNNLLC